MATRRKGNIKYTLKGYGKMNKNFTRYSNDIYLLTTSNEFKVYCYLCDKWNGQLNYAFPSLETIARETGISISTVKRAIKGLEQTGLIKVFKVKDYCNNSYRIYFPIITKNEIEEQLAEEEKQMQEEIDREVEEKEYTKEIYNYCNDDNDKNDKDNCEDN